MLPFQLPPIDNAIANPVWNGSKFQVGEVTLPILEYSSNLKGWNDQLTSFHEQTAGHDHPIDIASRKHVHSQINQRVTQNHPVILEIGCSSGHLLKELSLSKPDAILIGADIVYEPLLNLAKRLPNVPLIRFDILNCPLPNQSVDVVILLNVLEHIENDYKALEQMKRILKPGGILILEVPAGPHLYDSYDKHLLHYRRYRSSEFANLVNQLEFKILKKSHLGFFLYPLFYLAKRKNQFMRCETVTQQEKLVTKNIKHTSNRLLHYIMQIELGLGRYISYPLGIRCLLTCEKK